MPTKKQPSNVSVKPLFQDGLSPYSEFNAEDYSKYKKAGKITSANMQSAAVELIDLRLPKASFTKEQWLENARQLGARAAIGGDDIKQAAHEIWLTYRPNQKENLNRQGKGFVKFEMVEFANAFIDGAVKVNPSLSEIKRWDAELNKYVDFEAFWFGNPKLTELQAIEAFYKYADTPVQVQPASEAEKATAEADFGRNTVGAAEHNPNSYSGMITDHGVSKSSEKSIQPQPEDVAKVAQVLTKSVYPKLTPGQVLEELFDVVERKFTDSGNAINKVGRASSDPILYYTYNNAKQARQTAESFLALQQSNINGEEVGSSLTSIFEPIRKKGDTYYHKFSDYLFHMHNIDRMSLASRAHEKVMQFELAHPTLAQMPDLDLLKLSEQSGDSGVLAREYISLIEKAPEVKNKPVYGDDVRAETSRQKAAELLATNPEFKQLANQIYTYNKNLMQYRVDTGLISKESAEMMNEMYPHYVPTFRNINGVAGSRSDRNTVKISKTMHEATGSNKDLMPIHESMARQTMQTVQAGKRNIMGLRMLNDAIQKSDRVGQYVHDVIYKGESFDVDADLAKAPELRNTFTVYENGKPVTMKVSDGVYEGLQAVSSTGRKVSLMESGAKNVNTLFKQLVTGYNPLFLAKNFARDIQDAGLYTKDLAAFAKNYPKAWEEITKNGKRWRQYQSLGGFGSSIFDYESGYDTNRLYENKNAIGKGFDKIEQLNFVVEQAPRFAEFLATVEKGGNGYENLMRAMYNAADVTVNFGRSGTWGKTLNSTFVPFFNPAVQGTDKLIRTFTQAKGVKEWTALAIKAAALGLIPSLLNALLYLDDEEYKLINDRDKDTNYLFKMKDGLWAKIPKGRVVSLFGTGAQRFTRQVQGEENAWAGFIQFAFDQAAPVNPLTSHIAVQAVQTDLFNPDSPGRTWYGSDIEPQRLLQYAPGQRFDERTDYFSKWLGNALNLSPKKINYLLDSYTGVIGDFVLPLMTPRAERNPFVAAFTVDSIMSNSISGQFYDELERLKYAQNGNKDVQEYSLMYRHMNRQAAAVSDLNKEIRRIEMSEISDEDKKQEVREIKTVINGIQKNATYGLGEYEQAVRASMITPNYSEIDPSTKQVIAPQKAEQKALDMSYLAANRKVFGAEYALKVYSKDVYANAVKTGVSFETFFDAYFGQKDYSKSDDKRTAIDRATPKMPFNDREKLYKAFGVGLSEAAAKKYSYPSLQKAISKQDYYEVIDVLGKTEAKKDEFGNAITGTAKPKEIQEVARVLGVSNEKALEVYNEIMIFDHALSDMTSKQQATYRDCVKGKSFSGERLSEQQYIDYANKLKLVQGDKGHDGKTILGSLKRNRYRTLRQGGMSHNWAQWILFNVYDYKPPYN